LKLGVRIVASSMLVALMNCGDSAKKSTAPSVVVATPTPSPLIPELLYPPDNFIVAQNDQTTGCALSQSGYGFWNTFFWAPVPGAVKYHLYVAHVGATFPAIDRRVAETGYSQTSCNTYVAGSFLSGWYWRVAAVWPDGSEGEWSPQRALVFGPCATCP
jgi:hypothetical protein